MSWKVENILKKNSQKLMQRFSQSAHLSHSNWNIFLEILSFKTYYLSSRPISWRTICARCECLYCRPYLLSYNQEEHTARSEEQVQEESLAVQPFFQLDDVHRLVVHTLVELVPALWTQRIKM